MVTVALAQRDLSPPRPDPRDPPRPHRTRPRRPWPYPTAAPRSIRPEAQGNTSLFDNTQMHMWTPL